MLGMVSCPKIPDIPEEERTPLVVALLEMTHLQQEQIQALKDEIARLKGQKPRPKIKPSRLEEDSANDDKGGGKKRPGSARKSKRGELEIHETKVVKADDVPPGSGVQPTAKKHLHEIYLAATREESEKAFTFFVDLYEAKFPKAVNCLKKDKKELLAFYDFPAEHWKHIRTTNPIESTFATVRLRTVKTKGCLSRKTALAMVFKLILSARRKWRKLNGSNQLAELIEGVPFKDGIKQIKHAA